MRPAVAARDVSRDVQAVITVIDQEPFVNSATEVVQVPREDQGEPDGEAEEGEDDETEGELLHVQAFPPFGGLVALRSVVKS